MRPIATRSVWLARRDLGLGVVTASVLLALDVGFYGSFLLSLIGCPIWFLGCLLKGMKDRVGWRRILLRMAVPAVTLGLAWAGNAVQIKIADTNSRRIIAACERFQAANGSFPRTLDELVPDQLASVPRAKHCLAYDRFLTARERVHANYFFLWTPEIIDHLAEHEVTPQEFEEVVSSPEREDISRSTGSRRHVTMPISRRAVRRGPLDVAALVGWYNAASGRACPAVEVPSPVKPSMNDISCPPTPKPCRRWLQFSLRTLMVFVLFVSLGLGGLAMIIERARREARLHGTRNAFRWVYICLAEHDERCKHLPYPVRRETVGRKTKIGTPNGNGRPLYSWRGEISAWTQCGYSGSVRDRSEPWDSPSNQVADHVGPGPYCYSSHDEEWKQASCETNMLAICGPGTAFGCEGEPPRSLKSLGSNAILVVEVRHSGIHWMQPGDFDIRDMPRTINASDGRGISSRYPGGFHVLFSDGDVWFLSEKVPFETLAKFFTVDEANQCNRDDLLGKFVLWRFSMSRAT